MERQRDRDIHIQREKERERGGGESKRDTWRLNDVDRTRKRARER